MIYRGLLSTLMLGVRLPDWAGWWVTSQGVENDAGYGCWRAEKMLVTVRFKVNNSADWFHIESKQIMIYEAESSITVVACVPNDVILWITAVFGKKWINFSNFLVDMVSKHAEIISRGSKTTDLPSCDCLSCHITYNQPVTLLRA